MAGLTVIVAVFSLVSHTYVTPPEAVRDAVSPWQIVASSTVTTGGAESGISTSNNGTATGVSVDTTEIDFVDVNGCIVTATLIVYESPTCMANTSAICEGNNLEIMETGGDASSWNWSGPNNYTSTVQNPTIMNATAALNGIYTVVVTDSNGCTNSCETEVVVNDLPVLNSGTFIQGCEDPAGSFMADFNLNDAEDVANGDVDGDGADGSTATVTYHQTIADAMANINPLNNGMNLPILPFFARVESAEGCVSIEEVAVHLFVLPQYTIAATPVSDCIPGTADGSIIVSNLAPLSGYSIAFTDPSGMMQTMGISSDSNGEFIFTGLSAGNYSMVILFITLNGDLMCFGEELEIDVLVPDPPVVSIENITVCEGAQEFPIPFTSDCDGLHNFLLFFDDDNMNAGFMDMDVNGNIVFTIPDDIAPGVYDGVATITCSTLCNSTVPFTITVEPDPIMELVQSNEGCTGEAITFTATPSGLDNYEFYIDANGNGVVDIGESLQSSNASIFSSNTLSNGTIISVIGSSLAAAHDCAGEAQLSAVIIEPCPVYDVALMKVLTSTGPFNIGSSVSFDITVFNQGNQPVYNVIVKDYLPIGLDFYAADNTTNGFAANGDTAGGGSVTATINSLPANGMSVITINLKIGPAAQNGTLFNVAEIISASEDVAGRNLIDDQDDDLTATDGGLVGEMDNEIGDDNTGALDDAMDEDDFDFAPLDVCTVGCNGTFPWDGQ